MESEQAGNLLEGTFQSAATGTSFSIGVRCDAGLAQRCSGLGAAMLELRSVALAVQDDTAPNFAVGGFRSPASGTLDLDFAASDVGLGLGVINAAIDGTPVASSRFGGCAELSPADATVDLALGEQCSMVGHLPLQVDVTPIADGTHQLTTSVSDLSGNTKSNTVDNRGLQRRGDPHADPDPDPHADPDPDRHADPDPDRHADPDADRHSHSHPHGHPAGPVEPHADGATPTVATPKPASPRTASDGRPGPHPPAG